MARLDHVNIHTRDPDRMIKFLTSVDGAQQGHRPPFSNPGHWLYLEDRPAIHLDVIQRETDYPAGIVNHVAFAGYDRAETERALSSFSYPFRYSEIPDSDIGQFFVTGPEGLALRASMPAA